MSYFLRLSSIVFIQNRIFIQQKVEFTLKMQKYTTYLHVWVKNTIFALGN